MKSESLNEAISPDGHEDIEAGTPKPDAANGREKGTEPTAQGKALHASAKRRAKGAVPETDIELSTRSYRLTKATLDALVRASSMNSTQQRKHDESFGSDFRAALVLLREKVWLIILCVLLAGIAGGIYIIVSPNIYRAQAIIRVEQEGQKLLKNDTAEAQDFKAEEFPKTIEQSLTSPELLLGLIERNNLNTDPVFLPGLKRPVSDVKMAEELAKHISAQVRRGTRLIDIKVEDRSPVMAQKIADLLIKEFFYQNFRRHMEGSELASNFLLEKADRLKAKLAKSEEALQTYKEEHQAGALGEKENTVVEKLSVLNRMVAEAKATRLKLEADYGQMKKLGNSHPAGLLAIQSVANSPGIIDLEKTITGKEMELVALKKWYGQKHPNYVAVVSEIEELKAGLDRKILEAAEEVTSAYDSAATTEKKMEEALQQQQNAALKLGKMAISYNVLRQEVDSDRALYESVLTRLKETDATKDVSQDTIQVVSHPLLPERPVAPHKLRILLLSIFGGLTLGCGLSLLSRTLDRSFRTPDEAERRLGVPALADIPKALKMNSDDDCLVLVKQPGSAAAESFRSLRASLSLLPKDEMCKTFLFTSAVPSEGKSFCAINCAVAFAQQGLETLLVDADLRLPSVERVFFNEAFDEAPVRGLTDVLVDEMTLDDAAQPTRIDKLSVLCAGHQVFTPAELLASEACGRLIHEATAKFDRVVVNSAPLQPVSDTLLLAGHVQAICLVISAQTSAEVVSRAVQRLGNARSKLIGFVFDRVSLRHDADYGYPYSQATYAGANTGSRKRQLLKMLPHFRRPVSPS
jgi:succinoglycan biosynthesis transport protein ExoP